MGGFRYPVGLCVDAAGKIYVAEQHPERLLRMDDMNGTNWIAYAVPRSEPLPRNRHMGSWIFVDDTGHI